MTQVDFYVLTRATHFEDQARFACRLAEKAFHQQHKVCITTDSQAQSEFLNTLLWEFKSESFLPHTIHSQEENSPIVISHDENTLQHHDVLINLRQSIPKQFSRFTRLAEIVIQEESALKRSRENYAFYKQRGYPINTHKLNS